MSDSSKPPSVHERGAYQNAELEVILLPHADHVIPSYDDVSSIWSQQRHGIFYDELVQVLVILTANLPLDRLQACLSVSQVTISAHLTAFPPHTSHASQPEEQSIKLVLDSTTVAAEPVLTHGPTSNTSLAAFSIPLHLHHPERPLTRPSLTLAASVILTSPRPVVTEEEDEYLPSGIPLSANLLSPLLLDPSFAGTGLNLPASRLEKVMPVRPRGQADRPIRGQSRSLSVSPAVLLKTSRTLFPDNVYLSVSVAVPGSSQGVTVANVEARLPDVAVHSLATIDLPAKMRAGDRIAFVFRAATGRGAEGAAQFRVTAQVGGSGDDGERKLVIRRTLAAPPGAKVPTRERVKHWTAPKSASRPASSIMGPREGQDGVKRVKISVGAPREVELGEVFKVRFFLLNQSARKRRLAILAPHVGGNGRERLRVVARAKSSEADVADPVMDARELYDLGMGTKTSEKDKRRSGVAQGGAVQRHRADVVPVDTELKLGTLQPGACHEVAMRMQAVNTGIITLEGIMLMDLDSRESCVIGEGWEGLCMDKTHTIGNMGNGPEVGSDMIDVS